MLKRQIDAAICRIQCDLALKNATYVNVFNKQICKGDIGIVGDRIVGVGSYSGKEEIDVDGLVVTPSFTDSHVHIESSQLSPQGFASLVVPRGTTTVIADPHEIVNVCGVKGAEYIKSAAAKTPLSVELMLPSCVPATPFETSGATLSSGDIEGEIAKDTFLGLGEFMNYPAVIAGDEEALKKLEAARRAGKPIDGHAPALSGKELNAYITGGVTTDHECEGVEEVEEKLAKGLYIMLRHGSSARNLAINCRAVNDGNYKRFLVCTDDRHANDIKNIGHIDDALRTLVACGVSPVNAVCMATINAAECYNLKWRGAIAPNYFADLAVVDNLKDFNVKLVIKRGVIVAREGTPLFESDFAAPNEVLNTVRFKPITAESFKLNINSGFAKAIGVKAGSIVTAAQTVPISCKDGDVVLSQNLLKLAVVERHKLTGNIGKGLLLGYGFKGGAIGITVAHDSHNLIIAGDDNQSMCALANALKECGGGMGICKKGEEAQVVPLEIGGIMTAERPERFILVSERLYEKAYEMGVDRGFDAFISLAFLSLAVVPDLKLLDRGLFDVTAFNFTDIEA